MRSRVVFAVLLLIGAPAFSARVYFGDQPTGGNGSIISVAPDGTDQRTVITVSNAPDLRGIAYHRGSGRVYYLDSGTAKKIYSILPDGTGQQEIASLSSTFSADLEIDESAGKVYWAETANGIIRRANLNGTTNETAVNIGTGTYTAPYFMFVDAAGGYVYWGVTSASSDPSNFRRAALDGSIDPSFLIASPTRTRDIAIDPGTGTAYWCDRQTGTIFKRALSGGVNETVINGMNAPHGIAVDVEAEKIYWADTGMRNNGPFNTSARHIARCNFDGTEYENISAAAVNSEPWDLTLDLASPDFGEWRTRFFSVTTPQREAADDADGDGATNLLEYAMGTHPRKATSVPRIAAEGTTMRYVRRRVSRLLYRVEVSTDLTTWHYNGDGSGLIWVLQTSATPLNADLESVVVRGGSALSAASEAFFRVRVTMQ
jgi:hypothetical protein